MGTKKLKLVSESLYLCVNPNKYCMYYFFANFMQ